MNRKTLTSLNEAALQVQRGTTPEPEVNDMVLEYFESYFGGSLNESVSDEDIMEAVYDLVDLTEAVCEATGFKAETLKRYYDAAFKDIQKTQPYSIVDQPITGKDIEKLEKRTKGMKKAYIKRADLLGDHKAANKIRSGKFNLPAPTMKGSPGPQHPVDPLDLGHVGPIKTR